MSTDLIAPQVDGPTEPPPETWYKHRIDLRYSLRELWGRRDMIYTLAERDIRANYKQAVLGFGWALITPTVSLIIFTVIFGRVKSFKVPGVPYALYMYSGMIVWNYFAGCLASGATAILGNLALMQKTHFPRECFPFSQMLEQVVYTSIAWIPLGILFLVNWYPPTWQVVFFPILVVPTVLFTAGIVLFFGAALIYIRDITNLLGILTQFGMFATPIIWPFSKIPVSWHGLPVQGIYSFINPLGPVMDSFRNIILLGKYPDWSLIGLASISSFLYFWFGYRVFKRLEVNFADIA